MILSDKLTSKAPNEKVEFLYRAIELLRIEHNEQGALFRDGKLSKEEWEAYLLTFEKRHNVLYSELNENKEALGLFQIENKESASLLKTTGRQATKYDTEIDLIGVKK